MKYGLNNKLRDMDTDIMRIICCFCVIAIHVITSNQIKNTFSNDTINTINSLCRFSVPVFIIISGKYLLSRKYTVGIIIKKCFILLLEMVIVSTIYLLFDTMLYDYRPNSFKEFISMVLTTPVHLWYIYQIIILYLFTPIMYAFIKNAAKSELRYAIIICFILGSLVYIPLKATGFATLKAIFDKCHLEGNLTFVACYLLGYYFERYSLSKTEKITVYILGILGLSVSVGASISTLFNTEIKTIMLSFFAPNVISQSVMFYVITKDIVARITKRFPPFLNNKTIGILAQSTYTIYLWHILIKDLLISYVFSNVKSINMFFLISFITFFVGANLFLIYKYTAKLFHKKSN